MCLCCHCTAGHWAVTVLEGGGELGGAFLGLLETLLDAADDEQLEAEKDVEESTSWLETEAEAEPGSQATRPLEISSESSLLELPEISDG